MSTITAQRQRDTSVDSTPVMLNVSKAAKLLKVASSTLRNYEKDGRIESQRLDNGYRQYSLENLKKLKLELDIEKNEKLLAQKKLKEERRAKYSTSPTPTPVQTPVTTRINSKTLKQPLLNKKVNKDIKLIGTVVPSLLLGMFLLAGILGFGLRNAIKGAQTVSVEIVKNQNEGIFNKLAGPSPDVLGYNIKKGSYEFYFHLATNFIENATFQKNVVVDQDLNVTGNENVTGLATLLGGIESPTLTFTGTGTINQLDAIDDVTETTLEQTLDINGDVVSVDNNGLTEVRLADSIDYAGELTLSGMINIDGEFQIGGSTVDATADELNALAGLENTSGGLYFSDGSTFKQDPDNLFWDSGNGRLGLGKNNPATTLDVTGTITTTGLRLPTGAVNGYVLSTDASGTASWVPSVSSQWTLSGNSLYPNSTSYNVGIGTSNPTAALTIGTNAFTVDILGNTTIADGALIDLSNIIHNDSAPQGLRLPQAAVLTNIAGGTEGYIAYDTTSDEVLIYDGSNWNNISGASSTLQQAYEAGNEIQLSAPEGDIRIYNDSSSEILFLDESTGLIGIGGTAPNEALDLSGRLYLGTTSAPGTTTNRLYNVAGTLFWNGVDISSSGGLLTDGGAVTYLNSLTDDLALGGTGATDSSFYFDVSTSNLVFEGSVEDGNELTFVITNPTTDKSIIFPDLSGTVSLLDQTIEGSEITNNTIEEIDLEITNGPTDNYLLTYDSGSGGFTWIDPATAGVNYWTDSGTVTYITDLAENLAVGGSTATDSTFFVNISTGNLVFEGATENTFETTLAITDPTADNTITLPNSSGTISLLDQTIEGSEITDNTIEEVDLEVTNGPTDNYLLSFDSGTGGFTWVDPLGAGTNYFTDGGTTTYLSSLTDNFAIGGSSASDSTFYINTATGNISFEGASEDNFETTFTITDPTADNNIIFPDAGGTVTLLGSSIDLASEVTGTLPATNGGLGFNGSGATNGQLPIGNGSGFTLAALTQSTGITITNGAGSIQIASTLGTTIEGSEITDNTIEEIDLEATNGPTDNYILTYDSGSGGFTWVDPASAGSNYWTDSGTIAFLSDLGDSLAIGGSTASDSSFFVDYTTGNISFEGSSEDAFETTFTITNPTADNNIIFPDASGTVSLLGSTIEGSEISDNTIEEIDLEATNGPTDNYLLTYDSGSGGFTWVDPASAGTNYWTDSGTITYLSGLSDSLAIGGSTASDSSFFVDFTTGNISFEGATENAFETTFSITDPTADNTIVIPNASGTVSLLGSTIEGSEITDNTIEEADLELTNSATDNYILTYDSGSGGFTWVDPASAGTNYWTDGGTITYLSALGDSLAIGGSTASDSTFFVDYTTGNISFEGSSEDAFETTFTITNPTADNSIIFPDASGTVSLLGSTIEGSEITDNTIEEIDLEVTNGPTGGYILSYDSGSGGFTWITNDGGSGASLFTDGGATTYLTSLSDNLSIGGTGATDSTFFVNITTGNLSFEGATQNAFETIFAITDPTADNTVTFPDASGTVSLLGSAIEGSEITDNTIEEVDLEATNGPTGGYVLTYDSGSGGFTWVANDGGSGASKWTDGGTVTYLTALTDDIALGGSDPSAPFFLDVSAEQLILTNTQTGLSFRVNDQAGDTSPFVIDQNGNVGIGNSTPSALLSVGADAFTVDANGNVAVIDGALIDLSNITHNDTAPQGFRLPQGAVLSNPNAGEGYIAYDTDDDQVLIYNGSNWVNVSGSATTLQQAYDAGNNIQLSNTEGSIRIYDDGGTEALFIQEGTAYLGLGGTAPNEVLDVNGRIYIAPTSAPGTTTNRLYNIAGALTWNGGEVTLLGQTIEGSEITDNTIEEADLELTNSATDNYILTFDSGSGGFTWVDPATAGTNYFTDGGTVKYLTALTNDLAIGGSTASDSSFYVNYTTGNISFEGATEDAFETTFTITDPTADNNIIFPNSGGTVSLLGATIEGSEITDNTIEEADLELTNSATDNYILTFDSGSGGFTWIDPATAGTNYWTDGGTITYLSALGDSLAIGGSTASDSSFFVDYSTGNISFEGSSEDAFETTFTITNPTADNNIIFPDAGGTVSLLGSTIEGSEITDNTIEEADLELTNSATDNYILTFDSGSGGFTWVDPATAGTNYFTDLGAVTYLTSLTDDLSIGGTASTDSAFYFDTSSGDIFFEGSSADGFETQFDLTNPTADRIITIPNASGEISVLGQTIDLAAEITGTLGVGNGGTGLTTHTSNGVLFGNGAGNIQATAAGAGGTILYSNAGTPTFGTVATVLGTTAFLQGGNSFAATGTIGTNDNNSLNFETNNIVRITLDTSNNFTFTNGATIAIDTISAKDSDGLSLVNTLSQGIRIGTGGNVGIGTTAPSELLDVQGRIYLEPIAAPATTTNKLYNIAGTLTWNAGEVSLLAQTIEGSEITDNTIEEADLELTNSATDNYILTYDSGSGGFTWVDPATAGTNYWTDNGAVTYLTSLTDDLALGGTGASDSSFFFDEGLELLTLTNTTSGLSFRVNDSLADTSPFVIDANGNVGIGTSTPSYLIDARDGTNQFLRLEDTGTVADFWLNPNGGRNAAIFETSAIGNQVFLGLGTTAPERNIHIYGDNTPGIIIQTTDSVGPSIPHLQFRDSNATVLGGIYSEATAADFHGAGSMILDYNGDVLGGIFAIRKQPSSADYADRVFMIDAAGQVGIGNTAPNALFTVGQTNQLTVNTSGNLTTSGNVAINGGSLTTTKATFNLADSNATTINFGGAATTIDIGAATGTTSILNTLNVDGNTVLGDAAGDTVSTIDGALWDLSSITHNDTAPQGLILPQGATLSNPSSGEGYLAWDTDNILKVYDGSNWLDVTTGAATLSLQNAYDGGNTIQLASGTPLYIYKNDSEVLDVANNAAIRLEQDGTGDSGIQFELTSGQVFSLGIDNSSTNDDFVLFDGNTARLTIDGSSGALTIANNLNVNGNTTLGNSAGDTVSTIDGALWDLSSITHNDTAPQGLILPQGTGFANPNTGEGHLAYDSTSNTVNFFDGVEWKGLVTTGASGSSKWTDLGGVTYLTSLTDDLAIGGSDIGNAPFYFDTSTGDLTISGSLGIGRTNPAYELDVEGTGRFGTLFATGTTYGNINTIEINSANSGTVNYISGDNQFITHDGTGTLTLVEGEYNGLYLNSGSNTSTAYGNRIDISSDGTATLIEGINLIFDNSGTTTDYYGIESSISLSGGNVTNSYGIALYSPSGGGTITNNYGLYIGDHSSEGTSSDFNIYSLGANSTNYFAGNIGIGTTGPNTALEIVGSITASGDLALNGGDLTTTNATFNLVDSNATTINFGGAATTLDLGAATGTTTINNALQVDGSTVLGDGAGDTVSTIDGALWDLSSITHNDTAPQGLILPQGATLSNPSSGEGYLAWDTDGTLHVYDGAAWQTITTGAATLTLQNAYVGGNSVQLSAGEGDIRFYNDSSSEMLFLDESSGFVGIGTTAPLANLHINEVTASEGDNTLQDISLTYSGGVNASSATQRGLYIDQATSGTVQGSGTFFDIGTQFDLNTNVATNNDFDLVSTRGIWGNVTWGGTVGGANDQIDIEGLNISAGGNLGTTGITKHLAGFLSASGTADSNVALELRSTGATTNWGIYTQNEDYNYFSGNVGIGITAPAYALDVSGDARMNHLGLGTNPSAAYGISLAGDSAYSKIFNNGYASYLEFGYNVASTGMTAGDIFLGGGTVGTSRGVGASLNYTGASFKVIQNAASATAPVMFLEGGATPVGDYLQIRSDGSTIGDVFNINASGNVGIGTTTPAGLLGINAAGNTAIDLNRTSAGQWVDFYDGTDAWGLYNTAGSPEGVLTADTGALSMDTTNGTLYVKTDDGDNTGWVNLATGGTTPFSTTGANVTYLTDLTEDLAVGGSDPTAPFFFDESAGNLLISNAIGIGTTAPVSELQIAGTTPTLTLGDGDAEDTQINFDGNAFDFHFGLDDTLDALVLGTGTTLGAGNILTITNGGSIGIGNTSPNALLDILGTTEQLRLSYDINNYLSFTIGSDGSLTFSDSGTDIATFSETGASFDVPASFNAAGDVSIAYDLQFTNQTSANIKSKGPLTIESGEVFESLNLTFQTYNNGDSVFNMTDGNVVINSNDPSIVFDTLTATDTDYWLGVIENSNSTDDDLFVIGDGLTPGSNSFIALNTNGNVGIGTTNPVARLAVASGTDNLVATFESSDDRAGIALSDDDTTNYLMSEGGFFSLGGTSSFATNNLNINSTTGNIGIGTTNPNGKLIVNSTSTTAAAFNLNADSLTTGVGSTFSFDALTSGTGVLVESAPGTTTTLSGDLFRINVGSNVDVTGNIFVIEDNGSPLFSVDQGLITSALPHQFTAAGDVSIAYDIQFTNQTASYIKSKAPLYIEAGESFENNDLTFVTYGSGDTVLDMASGELVLDAADPAIIFDSNTATDTDYWMGILNDAGGDDDDIFVIGDGLTPGSNSFLTVNTSGNVGVGTTAPNYDFEVIGSTSTNFIARFENLDTGSSAQGIAIQIGPNTNPGATNDFIRFYDGDGTALGAIEGNGSGDITTATGGADFAELFIGDKNSMKPGDIVCLDYAGHIAKASDTCSSFGVYSDSYSVLGNWVNDWEKTDYLIPVGLLGQIEVRVDGTNGAIQPGDPIEVSPKLGVGRKALNSGQVVGRALEGYITNDPKSVKRIRVLVQPSWFDPINVIDASGNLTQANANTIDYTNILDKISTIDINEWTMTNNSVIKHMGPDVQSFYEAFGIGENDKLASQDVAGIALAGVKGLIQRVNELELNSSTNDLQDISIEIENLGGDISTVSADVNDLRNEVTLINELLQNQNKESTESTESSQAIDAEGILADIYTMYTQIQDFVTSLGMQVSTDEFGEEVVAFTNDVNITGNTTLYNTTITGDLNIGLINIDSLGNAINVTGPSCYNAGTGIKDAELCESQTLYVQQNLAGNVNLFDGGIVLETDGTINAERVVAGAISIREDSGTIGTDILPAGTNTITIYTGAVEEDSVILVTPETSTDRTLAVTSKNPGIGFTIEVIQSDSQDIEFSWLIIAKDKVIQ